jgi:hypothetical protein
VRDDAAWVQQSDDRGSRVLSHDDNNFESGEMALDRECSLLFVLFLLCLFVFLVFACHDALDREFAFFRLCLFLCCFCFCLLIVCARVCMRVRAYIYFSLRYFRLLPWLARRRRRLFRCRTTRRFHAL